MSNKILQDLNPQQKEAVKHDKGPLLIIAGAGTGKTSVITRRIAYLIETKKALPEEIVALTFTEKAAANMEEGVDILVPYGYTNVWISTFHAFGDRILRENALAIGLDPNFKVLTRPEQIIFFKEHLFEFSLDYFRPLSDPTRFIEALISLFSRSKDEDTSPEEYLEYVRSLEAKLKEDPQDETLKELVIQQKEVAHAYAKYQELMRKNNKVDFGDQVYLCLKLLREHPLILKTYQKQFKYILVDEFQDTNYSQFELVKLLAAKDKNLTVVGDDDQCLPSGTLIETPLGQKKVENVTAGEEVITGVGRGHVSISNATKVFKRKKLSRFLTFKTEKGYKITVTDNHKMFCFIPPAPHKKDIYYVYLMCRMNLGWRIGVTNDLAGRLRLERSADKIIGLRGFYSEKEASYYETLWSLKYGIPTACFKARGNQRLTGSWLDRLYDEINVNRNVVLLAKNLKIDLNAHHVCLDSVNRGGSKRVKIHLEMCYRRHRTKWAKNGYIKNPMVSHTVHLQTSQENVIKKLEKAGIVLQSAKKGKRFRFASADIKKVGELAYKLCTITDGILESKFSVGTMNIQYKPALIMSASNVLIGHYLPVMKGSRIIYDRVINISEKIKEEMVYDLEIERTHNFIANKIVVHNSIYKFRGAAISNILNFMDTYKDAKEVVLTKNYRSTQIILDRAYTLIKNNNPDRLEIRRDIDKKLEGVTKKGKEVKHLHFDTVSSEADGVAELINTKIISGKYKYSDFAILVRSNNDADPFIRALNMRGIPWRFSGNQGLYSRQEIRLLTSFLKAISNLSDSISLFHLVSSEVYKFNMLELNRIMDIANRNNRSLFYLFQNLENFEELKEISDRTRKDIEWVIRDIEKFTEASRDLTTGRVLYKFLTETGYLKSLVKSESAESEEKVQNIARFFELVKDFETIAREDRVVEFVSHLDSLIEAGDDPATVEADIDTHAVNILTVHKAKGLEFRVVFLVSLVMGKFPWPRRKDAIEFPNELIKEILPLGDFHTQEERRLFYVGMTRAKKELYLISARDYGGLRERRVSQFVLEALDLPKPKFETKKTSAVEVIERHAPQILQKPKKKKKSEEEILTLSYLHVDDYSTCPLKYKYVHIMRVPVLQHHTVVYGKAVHDAVQFYHIAKIKNKPVSVEELIDAFRASWVSEGFLTRLHEEERLKAGEAALKRFFEEQETLKKIPTLAEEKFSFKLDNNLIKGRWDRIDVDDGVVTIIDFKTSQITKEKEAHRRARESVQLSIYSLAYKEKFGKIPDRVELHFIESGLVGTSKRTEEDLEEMVEKIREVSRGIREQTFDPNPRYLACRFCAFSNICPYTASGG